MKIKFFDSEVDIPGSEYPRPSFVRDSWLCLNGEWDFAYDYGKSGEARGMAQDGEFPLRINVPFCPESKLSGIGNTDFIPSVWYRRSFFAEGEREGRIILHFGAVDYLTKVYINGKQAGTHKGGYTPFEIDITELVTKGENVITVYAEDDQRGGKQNFGKQSLGYKSSNCSYTRITGIWQTVWLEFVPERYLCDLKITPHAASGRAEASIACRGARVGDKLVCRAYFDGREVYCEQTPFSGGIATVSISPSEIHLWDVGKGNLYDLELELISADGEMIDRAKSYFALRDITFDSRSLLVNGKRVFMRLILDQGFYPEGINTPQSAEDMRCDIELAMALGFNGARFHQRVFGEQSLYWADKLGYMVWAEMPSGIEFYSMENIECYLPEWLEIVKYYYNHPSVIGWCPHNETYHQDAIVPYSHTALYDITKALDPYRPVIDASGGTHFKTDMFDTHIYEQNPEVLSELLEPMKTDESYAYTASTKCRGSAPLRIEKYEGQPYWLSEYGGAIWNPKIPENERGWGYGESPKTEEEFVARYEALTRLLLEHPRVCGFCYTQLTDVEQEQNGLYYYSRERKLSDESYERIRKMNSRVAAIERDA